MSIDLPYIDIKNLVQPCKMTDEWIIRLTSLYNGIKITGKPMNCKVAFSKTVSLSIINYDITIDCNGFNKRINRYNHDEHVILYNNLPLVTNILPFNIWVKFLEEFIDKTFSGKNYRYINLYFWGGDDCPNIYLCIPRNHWHSIFASLSHSNTLFHVQDVVWFQLKSIVIS